MQVTSDNGESHQAQTDHNASVDTPEEESTDHDDSSVADTVRLTHNLKD